MSQFYKSFKTVGAKKQQFRFTFHLDKLFFGIRKLTKVQIQLRCGDQVTKSIQILSLAAQQKAAAFNEILEMKQSLFYKNGQYQAKICKIELISSNQTSQNQQIGWINVNLAEYVNRSANTIP